MILLVVSAFKYLALKGSYKCGKFMTVYNTSQGYLDQISYNTLPKIPKQWGRTQLERNAMSRHAKLLRLNKML